MSRPTRIVILGAAGRDFHNFNTVYRDNPAYQVVAFTATQIPDIAGRRYPAALAGGLYPDGIPILDEGEHDRGQGPGRVGVRRAHRQREEPDDAPGGEHPPGEGAEGRRGRRC